MADIDTHASLTVTAAGFLIAHIIISNSTISPVPQNQCFDGSADFITRFLPEAKLIKPSDGDVRDIKVYGYMLFTKTLSGTASRSVTAMSDTYIGPDPRDPLEEGIRIWGATAYMNAVVAQWAARGWNHVVPLHQGKPLASSIKSSRGHIQCWALNEGKPPRVPIEPLGYMRRREDGSWPTLADVFYQGFMHSSGAFGNIAAQPTEAAEENGPFPSIRSLAFDPAVPRAGNNNHRQLPTADPRSERQGRTQRQTDRDAPADGGAEDRAGRGQEPSTKISKRSGRT